jgi:hypothetical protein
VGVVYFVIESEGASSETIIIEFAILSKNAFFLECFSLELLPQLAPMGPRSHHPVGGAECSFIFRVPLYAAERNIIYTKSPNPAQPTNQPLCVIEISRPFDLGVLSLATQRVRLVGAWSGGWQKIPPFCVWGQTPAYSCRPLLAPDRLGYSAGSTAPILVGIRSHSICVSASSSLSAAEITHCKKRFHKQRDLCISYEPQFT